MKGLEDKLKFMIIWCLVCMASFLAAQQPSNGYQLVDQTTKLPISLLHYQPKQLENKVPTLIMADPLDHWGFICKWEHRNDQKQKLPMRFRLGTLEYVNKLEGKYIHSLETH